VRSIYIYIYDISNLRVNVDRNLKKLQHRTHIKTKDKVVHLPPGDGHEIE